MALSNCEHSDLQTEPSAHAEEVGYLRPPLAKRLAAATPSGRIPLNTGRKAPSREDENTFPAPLVLPDDELAYDPKCSPQSLRSWIQEKARNPVTQQRKTLYVAHDPNVGADVSSMKRWIQPVLPPKFATDAELAKLVASVATPKAEDVLKYLEAFYHGMPVKPFPGQFSFGAWSKKRTGGDPDHVGLRLRGSSTQVRCRPCPDGTFARQLNLNDILDAVIEALPDDAYSVLLLVDHDLYEDEDDDFCCGRAYGGSRVCVVSSARYHPVLDSISDVDHAHMWPASHCKAYVARECNAAAKKRKPAKSTQADDKAAGPVGAALRAACAALDLSEPYALWFSRVARTASHELGHCLALDHCIYYACVMQGTAGMAEDFRQPPYLCPVCLSKVTRAVSGVEKSTGEEQYIADRYRALSKFCQNWKANPMFAGYAAWLDNVLSG